MSHLQRLLRGVEANEAKIDELTRQLNAMEKTIQNMASDSFGDVGESGNLFVRPGEIRIGDSVKLDKDGLHLASVGPKHAVRWRATFADVVRTLLTSTIVEEVTGPTLPNNNTSLIVQGEEDWVFTRYSLTVTQGNAGGFHEVIVDEDPPGPPVATMVWDIYLYDVDGFQEQREIMKMFADRLRLSQPLLIKERDVAVGEDGNDHGQVWVKSGSPNELYFTDNEGTDWAITKAAMGGVHTPKVIEGVAVGETVNITVDPFVISVEDALNVNESSTVSGLRPIGVSDGVTVGDSPIIIVLPVGEDAIMIGEGVTVSIV